MRIRALLADQTADRSLVFSRTKHGADRIARHLVAAGIDARAIHGNKSQAQRTAALDAFRQGACRVLVATDIAARGIDVAGVSHVFNFELPNVPEQYVHRIGRTARAGANGVAISFCAPDEKTYLRDIQRLTSINLDPMSLPADFLIEASKLPQPARHTENDDRGHGRGGDRRGGQPRGGNGQRNGGGGNSGAPGAGDGEAKRRFRPRGAPGVGQHRNKVTRVN